MSDFVRYEPEAHSLWHVDKVVIRPAVSTDVDALASVMAVRGSAAEEYESRAGRLIECLDVLLIAEKSGAAGIDFVGGEGVLLRHL